MKFFVDTADVSEIRALSELGLVDGVTTNPSIIAKSGRRMAEVIAEICAITEGPVSAEVTATDATGMLAEGRYLRGIAREVPGAGGRLVSNPHRTWRDVAARLPDGPICVMGPPATSGTRDSLGDLALMPGCLAVPEVAAIADAAA